MNFVDFFPEIVYRCDCLADAIASCLSKETYSFKDICIVLVLVLIKMYPKKVYHCPCVAFEIKLCLVNGHYSLKDIVSKLNEKVNANRKIYCTY